MDNEDRMQTVAGALEQFGGRGYREEMTVRDGRLRISGTEGRRPDEVAVRDYWRFEGVSDSGVESVVYAIETSDGVKGTLVDAYNVYADPSIAEFLREAPSTARPVEDPKSTLPPFERSTRPDETRVDDGVRVADG